MEEEREGEVKIEGRREGRTYFFRKEKVEGTQATIIATLFSTMLRVVSEREGSERRGVT